MFIQICNENRYMEQSKKKKKNLSMYTSTWSKCNEYYNKNMIRIDLWVNLHSCNTLVPKKSNHDHYKI